VLVAAMHGPAGHDPSNNPMQGPSRVAQRIRFAVTVDCNGNANASIRAVEIPTPFVIGPHPHPLREIGVEEPYPPYDEGR